jgi:hypothetical protein
MNVEEVRILRKSDAVLAQETRRLTACAGAGSMMDSPKSEIETDELGHGGKGRDGEQRGSLIDWAQAGSTWLSGEQKQQLACGRDGGV